MRARGRTSSGCWQAPARRPGSVIPSASQTMCIELAVPMPAHTPGPVMAWSHIPASDSFESLSEHRLHRADEHLFDVDVLALVVPARLVTADDEDGRDVETAGRHQVRRRRLVTRRQADHAVELRALDGDLHVVDDEVAAGQHVAAAFGRADDEVARAPRCESRTEGRQPPERPP